MGGVREKAIGRLGLRAGLFSRARLDETRVRKPSR
jgi:hypothetical protein